jgi:hypothetical protein
MRLWKGEAGRVAMTDDRAVLTLRIQGQSFSTSLPVRGSPVAMVKELSIALARVVAANEEKPGSE